MKDARNLQPTSLYYPETDIVSLNVQVAGYLSTRRSSMVGVQMLESQLTVHFTLHPKDINPKAYAANRTPKSSSGFEVLCSKTFR